MVLQAMINLKNAMKVFVYFGITIAKTGVFIDIFPYYNVRKSIVFFSPSISNQMSLLSLLYNSSVAGGKQRGRLASNKHC